MIKSQLYRSAFAVLLTSIVFGFGQLGTAQAQGTFQVSGSSTAVSKTGQTELVGSVTLTVVAGTTVSGKVEFFLPNVTITNDASTGIAVTGTGALAGASINSVIQDNGVVIVDIPGGAVIGASLTVSGVRISAVGKTFTTLDASISSAPNSITAGQNFVRVVRAVADGLVVASTSQTVVAVANGVIVTAPGAIIVSEGWERAFSSAVGVAGQNRKTQVIFKVTGLPENVILTFPSAVSSDSGATLVTSTGGPVEVTNQPNPQTVKYEFNDSATSSVLVDSFSLTPALDFTGPAATGTALIQVGLGPVGAAIPDATFPSTDIPRFAEQFLPPLSSLPNPSATTTTFRFAVPLPPVAADQALTISNTTSGGALITVRARRENGTLTQGTNFTNEATRTLAARQSTTLTLTDLFGTGASVSNVSSIDVESLNSRLVINSIVSAGGRRFANSPTLEATGTYLPFDRRTIADVPQLTVYNTTSGDAPVSIVLRTSAGATLSTVQRTVPSLGAVREDLSSLFGGGQPLPMEGYIIVRGNIPVHSMLLNNPAVRPEEVPTLIPATGSTIFPFFVFGSGYNTVLEVVNPSDSQSARLILTAYSATGATLSSQPFLRTLGPNERQNFDFASIFALGGASPTVGYFSIAMEAANVTSPFASTPLVFGIVRITTDTSSVAVPLSPDARTQFYLTPAAEVTAGYTGLAILNPIGVPTDITVEAFSQTGTSLGSTTFTLAGNTARIQLLRELLPQSFNNDNVLVRIASGAGAVRLISFRGSLNLNELIYIPGQALP